ncbi:unnamed protein product [Onchocerca flexuosa]|uniref:Ovule protein n=1 Tax=Onchocerca flexuosa TaxID=387005 RepID=A0A183H0L5_9BILA|nr:unnamed protein product [Onchocerca flexuosa]
MEMHKQVKTSVHNEHNEANLDFAYDRSFPKSSGDKNERKPNRVSSTEDSERKDDENNCPDEVAGIAIDVAVVTNGGAAISSKLVL